MKTRVLDNKTSPNGGAGARGQRRGSAVIVVVGTLALLSVFAAVYLTIGQSDQRTAATVENAQTTADVERTVGRYIARVVGDDRLDVYAARVDLNEQAFFRENIDYPWIDFTMRSVIDGEPDGSPVQGLTNGGFRPSAGNNATAFDTDVLFRRFSPTGLHRVLIGSDGPGQNTLLSNAIGIDQDFRVPSDPWLASSEPSWVGIDPFDMTEVDGRIFSALNTNNPTQFVPERFWLDARGWNKISNVGPNGLFVNLFTLRNNFNAEPGFSADPSDLYDSTTGALRAPAAGQPQEYPRTSDLLSLLTFNDDNLVSATGVLPFGIGTSLNINLFENSANDQEARNTPAFWTQYQRAMLIPLNQPFPVYGRAHAGRTEAGPFSDSSPMNIGVLTDWSSPDFPDYQYADADGDGLADSRWFELVDATIPGSPDWILPIGEYRWFAATRIVDLSGRINVNTATDLLAPSTTDAPPGSTPAEIDLRGVLTLEHATESAIPAGQFNGDLDWEQAGEERLSPRFFELPSNEDILQDPSNLVMNPRVYIAEDYRAYRAGVGAPGELTFAFGIDGGAASRGSLIGAYAYDAVRRSIKGDPLYVLADRYGSFESSYFDDQTRDLSRASVNYLDNRIGGRPDDQRFRVRRLLDLSPFEPDYAMHSLEADRDDDFDGEELEYFHPDRVNDNAADSVGLWRDGALARRDYWYAHARLALRNEETSSPGTDRTSPFGLNRFGVSSLVELLTYEGINDDAFSSELERAVSGRYDERVVANDLEDERRLPDPTLGNTQFLQSGYLNFSPLFSTRPTAMDRLRHDDVITENNRAATDWQAVDAAGGFRPDGILDAETLALKAISPRARLTTLSGATPIRSRRIVSPFDRDLDNGDVFDGLSDEMFFDSDPQEGVLDLRARRLTADDLKRQLVTFNLDTQPEDPISQLAIRDANDLFVLGAQALMPGSFSLGQANRLNSWAEVVNRLDGPTNLGAHQPTQFQTMYYGHQGPELALRLAAHWAVNLDDSMDAYLDNAAAAANPTVRTVIVDENARALLNGQTPVRDNPWHYWQAFDTNGDPASRLDLNDLNRDGAADPVADRLAQGSFATQPHRQAATVFGIEPHPVLTEVAVWNVWADVNQEDNPAFPGVEIAEPLNATIDTTVNPLGNPDLMLHMIAFQIHNPFDVAIDLNSQTTAAGSLTQISAVDYYIEYNGRFFALIDQAGPNNGLINNTLTIPPRQTAVFYVLQEEPGVVNGKWDAAIATDPDSSAPGADVVSFVTAQLTGDAGDGKISDTSLIFRAREFNPDSTGAIQFYSDSGRSFLDQGNSLPVNQRTTRVDGADVYQTNREFRLWKSNAIGVSEDALNFGIPGEPPTSEVGQLWWQNDQLVDRMRDPAVTTSTVGRGFNIPQSDTAFAEAFFGDAVFPVPDAVATRATDLVIPDTDQGLTISRWASLRRSDHFDGVTGGTSNPVNFDGMIPAWMIERADGMGNIRQPEPGDYIGSGALAWNDFSSTSVYLGTSFFDWFTELGTNQYDEIGTLAYEPDEKHRSTIAASGEVSFPMSQTLTDLNGVNIGSKSIPWLIDFDSYSFRDRNTGRDGAAAQTDRDGTRIRLLDLLTALPVGPAYTPGIGPGFNSAEAMKEWHWMTLGEALAAALGFNPPEYYEEATVPNLPAAFGQASNYSAVPQGEYLYTPYSELWYRLNDSTGMWFSRLDGGRLRVDNYAAFINRDPDIVNPGGAFHTAVAPVFSVDGANPANWDVRIGNGVPMALNIVSDVTGLPFGLTADFVQDLNNRITFGNNQFVDTLNNREVNLFTLEDLERDRDMHSLSLYNISRLEERLLTTAAPGLINIQTASPVVMRSIPGLSPSMRRDFRNDSEYWPSRVRDIDGVMDANGSASYPASPNDVQLDVFFGIPEFAALDVPTNINSGGSGSEAGRDYAVTTGLVWHNVPDSAAPMLAYRDRTETFPRFLSTDHFNNSGELYVDPSFGTPAGFGYALMPSATTDQVTPGSQDHRPLDFRPGFSKDAGVTPSNAEYFDVFATNFASDRGRTQINGIWGSRGTPGFATVAETLSATAMAGDRWVEMSAQNHAAATTNDRAFLEYESLPGMHDTRQLLPDRYGRDFIDSQDPDLEGSLGGSPVDNLLFVDPESPESWALPLGARKNNENNPFGNRGGKDWPSNELLPPDASPIGGSGQDNAAEWAFHVGGPVVSVNGQPDDLTSDPVVVPSDNIPNDFAERLEVVNAMMNTTDVRSDYFAAWFIVRGYREDDVTGLSAEDPLLPTYQKRFLMIIDRTNVTRPGQTPRIVAFKEVPL